MGHGVPLLRGPRTRGCGPRTCTCRMPCLGKTSSIQNSANRVMSVLSGVLGDPIPDTCAIGVASRRYGQRDAVPS
jgi:hypothetical protein